MSDVRDQRTEDREQRTDHRSLVSEANRDVRDQGSGIRRRGGIFAPVPAWCGG